MCKCILCADYALVRKYFFQQDPLCSMHYAEYLEVLISDKGINVTTNDASSAFEKYEVTLEPTPLSETARERKAKREREAKVKEAEKKKSSQPAPKPYRDPFSMGM